MPWPLRLLNILVGNCFISSLWSNYLFGPAIIGVLGLGFISKYTFVLAFATIFISGLICRPYRGIIMRPPMLVSLAIAVLIVAPHVCWLAVNLGEISGAVSGKFEVSDASTMLDLL